MKAPRGIALVHALIIVAAISALATALLARAEDGRRRMADLRQTDQAALYLDAAARLTRMILKADHDDGATDHPGEFWAQDRHDVPIGLGRAGGRITDLQGRFNLNWGSADGADGEEARAALMRLALQRGLGLAAATRIARAVTPDAAIGPRALTLPEQLIPLAALSEDEFARIAPFLAALPAQTTLNVNTALPEVLAAFMPDTPTALISDALAQRGRAPFDSVPAAVGHLRANLSQRAAALVPVARLSVRSDWFGAQLEAGLDSATLHRRLILRRSPEDGETGIVQSLPEHGP